MSVASESKNTAKRDFLRDIEIQIQKKWEDETVFNVDAPVEDDGVESWLGTFPYPYMNGKLHLGHGFTVLKVDFAAGYERLKGKRALFPFAYHCTGMPICSAADKIKYEMEQYGNPPIFPVEEEGDENAEVVLKAKAAQKAGGKKYQWEILQSVGISDEEMPEFTDPLYWLDYFPKITEKSLKVSGCKIDWRRSFITTDVNPYYDAFVQWQFRKLKEQGRIKFGKRYTIYSIKDDGPCMDHDRSSGEGVGVSEYTIVKQRVLKPYPECLKALEDDPRPIYMVPATLRPETMPGQTNCWVDPNGVYGAFEMANDEIFVCTERSVRNMSYQDMTKEHGKVDKLAEFTGEQLIGTMLNAPMTPYEVIYVLPMFGVSCAKTTGVVTSVPSDSPDDFASFRDLKEKQALREKYGIQDSWVLDYEIVPVIQIPGYSDCAAKDVVEKMKIKSQNDTNRLTEAKAEVYLKGFTHGVMISGKYSGVPVKEAKEQVKQDLLNEGLAYKYCEPEKKVVSRSGDVCIVALCDQWYLDYSSPEWKALVWECYEGMEFYTPEIKNSFRLGIDWIGEHACSRSYGLGTKVPWDPEFLIDSLSDSTVYMIYYTIAHYLQGTVKGDQPGLGNITADDLSDEFFDFLFTSAPYPDNCRVPQDVAETMRREVRYFYPVDMRNSGKDLINNHLLFFIFNHVSLFDKEMWPRSIRANGHLLLNSDKMSKSTGNFITLEDAVNRYSADGMRFAIGDAGDQLEDANFTTETADSAIKKLWNLVDWIKSVSELPNIIEGEPSNYQERFFSAEMDNAIALSIEAYELMAYKEVVKHGFFEMVIARDDYLKITDTMGEPVNITLINRWIDVVTKLMAPITSHISEFIWQLMGNEGTVFDAGLPEIAGVEDVVSMLLAREYVSDTLKRARKNKAHADSKGTVINNVKVVVFSEIPQWKVDTVEIVKSLLTGDEFPEKRAISQALGKKPELKKQMKSIMPFVGELQKQFAVIGEKCLNLNLPFDEMEIWQLMKRYVEKDLDIPNVEIVSASDIDVSDSHFNQYEPGHPYILFEE